MTFATSGRLRRADLGLAFLALVIVNGGVFMALTPAARQYTPLVDPFMALSLYYVLLNTSLARTRHLIVTGAIALGVVEAVIALSQSFFGRPFFAAVTPVQFVSDRNYLAYLLPGISRSVVQGTGTFSHFNLLGAFLTIATCLAFGKWLGTRQRRYLLAFLVIAGGVWVTYSGGSLLGTLGGCLIVYVLCAPHSRRALVALGTSAAIVLIVLGGSFLVTYYHDTQHVTERFATWSYAAGYIEQHPSDLVLGTGFSFFQHILLVDQGGQSPVLMAMHSGPLQILLELGVFGFLLYLGALAVPILRTLRRPRDATSAAIVGALAGVLFSATFDNSTFAFSGVLMFGLVALLQRGLIEERKAARQAVDGSRFSQMGAD